MTELSASCYEHENDAPAIVNIDPSLSLAERVYRLLRTEIISARRAAGAELRERELAEELGVSRVPVREALPRLEAGGFVRIEPRRPAVITHISCADVAELYDLRGPVEATVARLAARAVSEGADPTPLRNLVEIAAQAHAAGEHQRFREANAGIHSGIVKLAGNPLIERVLAPLMDRTDRLNGVSHSHDLSHRHTEHELLVEAVASGNPEFAYSSAFVHIEGERARTNAALKSHPHYAGR